VNISYSIMNGLCKSADILTVETTHIGSAIRQHVDKVLYFYIFHLMN
jgi:hypothetical protein